MICRRPIVMAAVVAASLGPAPRRGAGPCDGRSRSTTRPRSITSSRPPQDIPARRPRSPTGPQLIFSISPLGDRSSPRAPTDPTSRSGQPALDHDRPFTASDGTTYTTRRRSRHDEDVVVGLEGRWPATSAPRLEQLLGLSFFDKGWPPSGTLDFTLNKSDRRTGPDAALSHDLARAPNVSILQLVPRRRRRPRRPPRRRRSPRPGRRPQAPIGTPRAGPEPADPRPAGPRAGLAGPLVGRDRRRPAPRPCLPTPPQAGLSWRAGSSRSPNRTRPPGPRRPLGSGGPGGHDVFRAG